MGYSLKRLLMELEGQDEKARAPLDCLEEMAFPTAFAFAVAQWHLPAQPALVAYLWGWLESQVMAAIKLVPLGQTDGQRILLALGDLAAMRVFRSDLNENTSAGLIRCVAKLGKKTLKVAAVFPEDIAGCIGTAPKAAKKKTIKLTLSLELDGARVSRTVSVKVT